MLLLSSPNKECNKIKIRSLIPSIHLSAGSNALNRAFNSSKKDPLSLCWPFSKNFDNTALTLLNASLIFVKILEIDNSGCPSTNLSMISFNSTNFNLINSNPEPTFPPIHPPISRILLRKFSITISGWFCLKFSIVSPSADILSEIQEITVSLICLKPSLPNKSIRLLISSIKNVIIGPTSDFTVLNTSTIRLIAGILLI